MQRVRGPRRAAMGASPCNSLGACANAAEKVQFSDYWYSCAEIRAIPSKLLRLVSIFAYEWRASPECCVKQEFSLCDLCEIRRMFLGTPLSGGSFRFGGLSGF
jgi:hypothetical protein